MPLTTGNRTRRSRLAQSTSPAIRRKKSREISSAASSPGSISPKSSDAYSHTSSISKKNKKKMQQPVLTTDTTAATAHNNRISKNLLAPRTVTPTGPSTTYTMSSAPSWEDYDEGLFGAVSKKAKQRQAAEKKRRALHLERTAAAAAAASSSPYALEEDMPMDEIMGSLQNSNNSGGTITTVHKNHDAATNNNASNLNTTAKRTTTATTATSTSSIHDVRLGIASNRSIEASAVHSRPPIVNTLSNTITNDDVSSLGGVEDHSTGIGRMINALRHNSSHRPNSLNTEERLLWEAIQKTIGATRQEHLAKRKALENQLYDSTSKLERVVSNEAELEKQLAKTKTQLAKIQKIGSSSSSSGDRDSASLKLRLAQLEDKLDQRDVEMKEKDAEHEAEVRAIQRVLADATTEREEAEQALEEKTKALTKQIETLRAEKTALEQAKAALETEKGEMEKKQSSLARQEKPTFEKEKKSLQKEKLALKEKYQALLKEKSTLQAENATIREEKTALEQRLASLQEEKSALESETSALQQERDALEEEKVALKEAAEQAGAASRALPATETSESTLAPEDVEKLKKLEEEVQELKTSLKVVNAEKVAAKRENDKKQRRLITLEREIKVTKTQLKKVEENMAKAVQEKKEAKAKVEEIEKEIAESKKRNEELSQELEEKERQLKKAKRAPLPAPPTPPRQASSFDNDSVSSEEVETLQRSLADTVSSLENAKKIIASLENANGSLALDMRAKVKAKEEELSIVQNESAERKRRLDSLATELRDLQRKQGNVDRAEKQSRAQLTRLRALSVHLQKGVSSLQSASVVHEISSTTGQPDMANVEQISEILSDTLTAVKTTLDMAEQCIDEFEDQSVAMTDVDLTSEVGRTLDAIIRNDREAAAKELKDELDQKRLAVRRLEDAMRKQSDEMKRLRAELDKRGRGGDDSEQLRAEIKTLREQCATNMDVLAKKERELSVLRSSLKVDENETGYISDDASDEGTEQDDEGDSCMSPNLNGYGHAEAEALATILSNGRAIDLPNRSREMEALKQDLLKAAGEKEKACRDLQAERESLANAKMIISSLEKANKSMMEDLRSRLQDSNTAIQSLLDKSMEHEKASINLKAEVEKLRKEKEEAEKKHQTQLKKLKDEAKVYSLRIASKDRELNDLRQQTGAPSSEEKKEDAEESAE